MLSVRDTLDTGPNLQGLMELAAAVGRAQKGGWGGEGRGRGGEGRGGGGEGRGGEGEGMDDLMRHIV